MAIPEVTVTEKRQTVPDSSFLYDSEFHRFVWRGLSGPGMYSLGEIPLGIPIGRADQQSPMGVNLGARYTSVNVINERLFEETSVSDAIQAQAIEDARIKSVRSGPPICC